MSGEDLPVADLEALLGEQVRSVRALDPGYSGHTNDVWLVTTVGEQVVVRAPAGGAWAPEPWSEPFWWGAHHLFGLDPRRLGDLGILSARISALGPLPVPCVLRQGMLGGRHCVVVQRMPGQRLETLRGAPPTLAEGLGEALAHIHAAHHAHWGHPVAEPRHPLDTFWTDLADTVREMALRWPAPGTGLDRWVERAARAAQRLPPPGHGALIMLDLDPTQFLAEEGRLTAVVDTEAYALGPAAWDLVAAEYLLDAHGAAAFARGYRRVAPLPRLEEMRLPLRVLARLLEIQGGVEIETWMVQPALFP